MKTLKDASGGLLIALTGLVFLIGARNFAVGDLRNIGPGFFPVALSGLAMAAGLLIATLDVIKKAHAQMSMDLRALACVAGAIVVYAALLERAGVLVTTVLAVFTLALARRPLRPLETLLLGAGLSAFIWAAFVLGLGMPLSLFPDMLQ